MATRILDPLFDLASYARSGLGRRDHLTPVQTQQIARTVGRTPEVMVKVLPRGANDRGAVRRHLDYIGRKGDVDLETDDGQTVRGAHVGTDLLEDWDLELDAHRSRADLVARPRQQAPRLVHKLMFSMPAGTPPDKVLKAVQNFFREEFALKHRYALALHTDEPHPHVHVVMKAVSEQGVRLHIRKATLRQWRTGFARHLRELGVPANATQRYVRGETNPRKPDGIYRASLRGESTHMRERAQEAARELARGDVRIEGGKAKLVATRKDVRLAWEAVGHILIREGHVNLAAQVKRFIDQMPDPITEREWWAARLVGRTRSQPDPAGSSHRVGVRLPRAYGQ
jgi:type IV secretory pathway VirD2 relaxase